MTGLDDITGPTVLFYPLFHLRTNRQLLDLLSRRWRDYGERQTSFRMIRVVVKFVGALRLFHQDNNELRRRLRSAGALGASSRSITGCIKADEYEYGSLD